MKELITKTHAGRRGTTTVSKNLTAAAVPTCTLPQDRVYWAMTVSGTAQWKTLKRPECHQKQKQKQKEFITHRSQRGNHTRPCRANGKLGDTRAQSWDEEGEEGNCGLGSLLGSSPLAKWAPGLMGDSLVESRLSQRDWLSGGKLSILVSAVHLFDR